MLRDVVVDHVRNVRDVEPAGRDVRGHENLEPPCLESLKRLLPLLLGPVRVDHRGLVMVLLQQALHLVSTTPGAAENDHALPVDLLEQRQEKLGFLRLRHRVDHVPDRLRRHPAFADLDSLRLVHGPANQAVDLGRNGGREKGRVPASRTVLDDPLHVGQETHVQHAIRLVENEVLDLVQLQGVLAKVIEQTPRRRHHDVHTIPEIIALLLVTHAAVHDRHTDVREARELPEALVGLDRQFARRLKHQRPRRLLVHPEHLDDRQSESSGLPRAGLGRADDVPPCQDQRHRLDLDRRGFSVTKFPHGIQQRGSKAKFREWHDVL